MNHHKKIWADDASRTADAGPSEGIEAIATTEEMEKVQLVSLASALVVAGIEATITRLRRMRKLKISSAVATT